MTLASLLITLFIVASCYALGLYILKRHIEDIDLILQRLKVIEDRLRVLESKRVRQILKESS